MNIRKKTKLRIMPFIKKMNQYPLLDLRKKGGKIYFKNKHMVFNFLDIGKIYLDRDVNWCFDKFVIIIDGLDRDGGIIISSGLVKIKADYLIYAPPSNNIIIDGYNHGSLPMIETEEYKRFKYEAH